MNASDPNNSLLEREIREQASVLSDRAVMMPQAEAAAARIGAEGVDYLLIAARGSSDNAARFGQYALGGEAHLSVALATPSLFRSDGDAPNLDGAAVLGISQSGQSPDIVSVLAAAKDQGRPTVALTNDPSSPLAEVADVIVPLAAGPERSVAATKTYLASLHALMQIVEGLSPDPERRAWLGRLPELVDATVTEQLGERRRFDPLDEVTSLTSVGRGLDFSTAHETALKIRELAGAMTEAFSPADLLHGPVAALGSGGGLWVVDTSTDADEAIETVMQRGRERGMRTVVVSRNDAVRAGDDIRIAMPPEAPRWVAAILAVLPGQVAALHLAGRRGVDLDRPHGLTKVTLTH